MVRIAAPVDSLWQGVALDGATPLTPVEIPMSDAQMLIQVFEKRAKAEALPMTEAVENVFGLLTDFTDTIQQQARHRALAQMMIALGEEPPPEPADVSGKVVELRTALHYLLDLLPPFIPPHVAPAPAPAPVSAEVPVVAPVPVAAPFAPVPAPEPVPVSAVLSSYWEGVFRRLHNEVEEISRTGATMHDTRRGPWVQAVLAEVRQALVDMPDPHTMREHFNTLVRRIGGICNTIGLNTPLRGLAVAHNDNWSVVAQACRRRVAKYDLDAGAEPATVKTAVKKTVEGEEDGPALVAVPPLVKIRERKGVVLLAGNLEVKEKLALFKKRFDLDAEWVDVAGSGRKVDVVISRIKQNNLRAVLVCQGFLDHNAALQITKACDQSAIPVAYAGNGGIGKIANALDSIERNLAA